MTKWIVLPPPPLDGKFHLLAEKEWLLDLDTHLIEFLSCIVEWIYVRSQSIVEGGGLNMILTNSKNYFGNL